MKYIEGLKDSSLEFGGGTFAGCDNLIKFSISKDNPNFVSVEGMLLTKDKSRLVACPVAKTIVNIPSSVTKIGGTYGLFDRRYARAWPFNESAALVSVTIPESVECIYTGFCYCSQLTEVHIKCTIPPYVYKGDAFGVMNDKCIFYVPKGTLSIYKEKFVPNIGYYGDDIVIVEE